MAAPAPAQAVDPPVPPGPSSTSIYNGVPGDKAAKQRTSLILLMLVMTRHIFKLALASY